MLKLKCCTPLMTRYTSGMHPSHSRSCPVSPGQRLRSEDVKPTPQRTVPHPAGADLPVGGPTSLAIWQTHPHGCACIHCQATEAHLDAEDDERGLRIVR